MAPYLLFYPVFYEAKALAGLSHDEVIHPAPQYRIDQGKKTAVVAAFVLT